MHRFNHKELRKLLRQLLLMGEDRHGLPRPTISGLVAEAFFNRLEPGEPLFETDDATDFVAFGVVGFVKVSSSPPTPGRGTITLLFTKPGQFILTGRMFEGTRRHRAFQAVAHAKPHEPTWVALWGQETITRLLGELPGERYARAMTCSVSSVMKVLAHKVALLGMDVPQRLMAELKLLVRTHGEELLDAEGKRQGFRLALPLGRQDLADLVVAKRETVCRAFKSLKRDGLVEMHDDGHVVVTTKGLSSEPDAAGQ